MHHAILIIGTIEEAKQALESSHAADNPDVRIFESERLTIDEARTIVREAVLLPVREEFRTFIVSFREATLEAQNALLKLLEEPPLTTRFCIAVPREDVLLETVRSRLMGVGEVKKASLSLPPRAAEFMKASYAKRLTEIADRTKEKDAAWMEEILQGMELAAAERKDAALMRAVLSVRFYFGSSGASKKMLLEHLALLAG